MRPAPIMPTFQNTISRKRISLLAGGLCLFVLTAVQAAEVRADHWMFRRSYYSHAVPPEIEAHYPRPTSRSAYRRALVGTSPGFAIRGGYRYNHIVLSSGRSTDVTVIREEWFNWRP